MVQSPLPNNEDGAFRCPICRKPVPSIDEPFFPFCCQKCKLIDLGNWVDGKYMLTRPLDPTDELEEPPSP